MSESPAILIENLSFAYRQAPVLQEVSLAIASREVVCMVGPNGGGKSTLLKLILGLLKPNHGSITVLGNSPERSRKRIGYVPQHMQFDPLFPITVREVVRMGRLGTRLPFRLGEAREARAGLHKALEEVGMGEDAASPFAELSGGQRQRVLIARALYTNPDILLLDEPTAMVDHTMETKLLATLRELHQRMTIILVSHDLGFVSRLVDSVICVNRRVVSHPTSQLSGRMIEEMYGSDVAMVRHDHSGEGADHGHGHDSIHCGSTDD